MRYISGEDILFIHSEIIDNSGGHHGIRDTHLFLSLLERPKASFGGKELYHGIFVKAAVYLESLAKFHVFIDGNKRTAFAIAARFLYLNDAVLYVTNKQIEKFIVEVVNNDLDVPTIAVWLEFHTKKSKYKKL